MGPLHEQAGDEMRNDAVLCTDVRADEVAVLIG
jgi:hypothetical protein